MHPLYLVLELAVAAFFTGAALAALRRGRLPFLELLSAAAFGILLEEGSQLIFGTYHYSADWVLAIDRAPLAIGLTWALILAGAMRLTDALAVRSRYAPFADGVLVVSLDLAFDAVAIRLGLWAWRTVGPTDAWFGVPAGNYYTWLFVALGFSLLTRWLRSRALRRPSLDWLQLAVPLPAFAVLLLGLLPFTLLVPIVDPTPGGGMAIFAVTLALFAAVATYGVWSGDRDVPDGRGLGMLDLRLAFAVRLAIHGFFLVALVALGLAVTAPALLAVSLALLAAEVPLARLVERRQAAAGAPALRPRAENARHARQLTDATP